jgi:plastocyanin
MTGALRRARLVAALAVLAVLALTACGAGDDRPRTAAPSGGDAAATVAVDELTFSPKKVEISAGETVDWQWDGKTVHDVAFDDGPASPKQREGTWQHTFTRPGRYDYVCTLHPGMVGEVVVR